MAGNEYYPTRPKTEDQDPARIAAGSPLAVMGIFLEGLRELFREDNQQLYVWRTDPSTTDLLIEAGYNTNVEARNYVRALYVNRLQSIPQQIAVGDRVGVRLRDHYQGFVAMMQSTMSIDCVSAHAGESALLGDVVQHFLLASKDIFEAMYGFHSMTLPQLGQTAPYVHDQDKFSTPVTFEVVYHVRWSTVKIRPLLAEIAMRARDAATGKDASGHFVEAAYTSLSRQWPLEPPTAGDAVDVPEGLVPATPGPLYPGQPAYPSYTYTILKHMLALGTLGWDDPAAVFRILLVTPGYVFSAAHVTVAEVSGFEVTGGTYARITVLNRTVNLDLPSDTVACSAEDPLFPLLEGTATSLGGLIVYRQQGGDDTTPGDDYLVAYLRFVPEIATDGSSVRIELENGRLFTVGAS